MFFVFGSNGSGYRMPELNVASSYADAVLLFCVIHACQKSDQQPALFTAAILYTDPNIV